MRFDHISFFFDNNPVQVETEQDCDTSKGEG